MGKRIVSLFLCLSCVLTCIIVYVIKTYDHGWSVGPRGLFLFLVLNSNHHESMLAQLKISLQRSRLEDRLGRYQKEKEISRCLSAAIISLIKMADFDDAAKRRGSGKTTPSSDLPRVTPAIRSSILKYTDSGCFLLDGEKWQICEIDDLKHVGSRLQIFRVGCPNCRIRTFESPPAPLSVI